MRIFCLRHGKAENRADRDFQRQLTPQGVADVGAVIRGCAGRLAEVERIISSPYTRARQSAEIAARELAYPDPLTFTELLQPEAELSDLIAYLRDLESGEGINSVLLVTHQPLIGELVSHLSSDSGWLHLGTANLVAVQAQGLAPGFAEVLWLRTPHD